MNAHTLSTPKTEFSLKALFVWFLIALCIALSGAYFFFINTLVGEVQVRKNLEESLQTSRTAVGELEFRYVSLSSRINLEVARSLGFSEVTDAKVLSISSEALSFQR